MLQTSWVNPHSQTTALTYQNDKYYKVPFLKNRNFGQLEIRIYNFFFLIPVNSYEIHPRVSIYIKFSSFLTH